MVRKLPNPDQRRLKVLTELSANFQKLSLKQPQLKQFEDEESIAESWEQESSSSEDESSASLKTTKPLPRTTVDPMNYPAAPPPTPSSPNRQANFPLTDFSALNAKSRSTSSGHDWSERKPGERSVNNSEAARPEKTTAAASRMIAGALGVRVPKRSEEEIRYEKAVREKELARRERQREEKRRETDEREKARASVWDG